MRLKKPIVSTGGALALVVLAACGGGSGDDGANAPEETFVEGGAAGEAIDPNREAPAPEIEGAKAGGTATVLSVNGLTTMDPTEAYYTNTGSILSSLVTRSLTQYVYDEEQKGMVLIPDIATDTGTSNDDYTEWTFTIRDGVKFEDGTPVTAEDVAYGIKRSMDRDTFPGGAAYSNDYFLDGDKYKGPYKSGENYKGVVVKGNKLTIKMERPFADMPYWGAFPAIGPIPKDSDPADYALHPMATGPYKFADYEPGESLTLVQNDQWDPATDPGRHQYIEQYDMKFTELSKQIDSTILADTGEGQTTLTFDNILSADYQKAKQEAGDRLVLGSSPCTYMWTPDYRTVPLKVRQAAAYAYPYQDVWTAAGEIIGVTRVPGTAILPPGIPGREDYNPLEVEPGQHDPEKSKALLKEAGFEPGEYELKFLFATDDPASVAGKDQLVTGLEAGGFKATPVASTVNEIPTLRADPNYRKINVRSWGWCSDWPSGGSWFQPLFGTGGSNNYSQLSEPAVDKEIKRIGTLPLDEQPAAWAALDQEIMTKYFPGPNTGYVGTAMLHGSKIAGMNNDDVFGMPTWKDMYITE
ncbi:MAG TPA: ABC transporter substrate-binding protein [Nocardioidaceae bacterium]|nr:ABC transporter substrate-binding protein [Nocardioidaceae bacterium]